MLNTEQLHTKEMLERFMLRRGIGRVYTDVEVTTATEERLESVKSLKGGGLTFKRR